MPGPVIGNPFTAILTRPKTVGVPELPAGPLVPEPESTTPRPIGRDPLMDLGNFMVGALGIADALDPSASEATTLGGVLNAAIPVVGGLGAVIAGKGGIGRAIKAYHGTAHDFDKFRLDKIGTGEGAQVYGHGLYFTENEDIAKWYRSSVSNRRGGGTATSALKGEAKKAVEGGIKSLDPAAQSQALHNPNYAAEVKKFALQRLRDDLERSARADEIRSRVYRLMPPGEVSNIRSKAAKEWAKSLVETKEGGSIIKTDPVTGQKFGGGIPNYDWHYYNDSNYSQAMAAAEDRAVKNKFGEPTVAFHNALSKTLENLEWPDGTAAGKRKIKSASTISKAIKWVDKNFDSFVSQIGPNAKTAGPKGHMYEVRINADPDKFLDWEKSLKEQPEEVRLAVLDLLGGDVREAMQVKPNPTTRFAKLVYDDGTEVTTNHQLFGDEPRWLDHLIKNNTKHNLTVDGKPIQQHDDDVKSAFDAINVEWLGSLVAQDDVKILNSLNNPDVRRVLDRFGDRLGAIKSVPRAEAIDVPGGGYHVIDKNGKRVGTRATKEEAIKLRDKREGNKIVEGAKDGWTALIPNPDYPNAMRSHVFDTEEEALTAAIKAMPNLSGGAAYRKASNRSIDWDNIDVSTLKLMKQGNGYYMATGNRPLAAFHSKADAEAAIAKYKNAGRIDPSELQFRQQAAPDRASADLVKRGVPGIKYLDASSRGGRKDEPTRNFVVFDDNMIDILTKWGILAPVTGAAVASQLRPGKDNQ